MQSFQASIYDRDAVKFMWQELEAVGISPLTTAAQVDKLLKDSKGTALVIVNSVCGCSAGNARPGVAVALQNNLIPDHLATVFAGVDMEAVQRAREYMTDMPPSSPSVALFRDGKLVYMLHRRDIEGSDAHEVAEKLTAAFNQYCTRKGPSVSAETVQKVFGSGYMPGCSSDYKLKQ